MAERAHLYAKAAVGARVKFEYKDENDVVILSLDETRRIINLLTAAKTIAEEDGRHGCVSAFAAAVDRLTRESSLWPRCASESKSPSDVDSASLESPASTPRRTPADGNATTGSDASSASARAE